MYKTLYKVVRIFCLRLKISITASPNWLFFSVNLYNCVMMVLGYFPDFSPFLRGQGQNDLWLMYLVNIFFSYSNSNQNIQQNSNNNLCMYLFLFLWMVLFQRRNKLSEPALSNPILPFNQNSNDRAVVCVCVSVCVCACVWMFEYVCVMCIYTQP